jgi:agmatinase
MKKYYPPISLVPRISGNTFMNLPEIKNLDDDIDFLVTGIPWDGGVSNRAGAKEAPSKIREISTSLRPYNTYHEMNIFDYLSGVDYGDLQVKDVESLLNTSKEFEKIAKKRITPFTIGGDHSITYPELKGLAKIHGPLSLIHFDAHFDSIDEVDGEKYGHGSFVIRALEESLINPGTSIQVGMRGSNYCSYDGRRLGLKFISMEDFVDRGVKRTFETILDEVAKTKCFVSIDIDGIDPAYAPGTGTPEPGGFTSREMIGLIRGLKGTNIIGADVVEVSPPLDTPNDATSYLASTLLFELISLKAVYEKHKK